MLFLITSSFFSKVYASPLFEFRAVWVTTVHNIDWPSRPGLDVDEMKSEARSILDLHQQLGMNVVILQVRPGGDAIYRSTLEPWSRFLTGRQGVAPCNYFDPLQFWIEEAHARQLALHAWINPFRAASRADEPLHESHPAAVNPGWVVRYANQLVFNPGMPEVIEHVRQVVADIVSRYDIDGLHIDDYFYPYPVRGEQFNDAETFKLHGIPAGFSCIEDWRRDNINRFIQTIHQTIKEIKPWVKFGISPFGVWRNVADDPRGSNTTAGVTCYDDLYADVLYWYENGWFDYLVPQVYWSINCRAANFNVVSNWWDNKIRSRHLYIGHAIYKINNEPNWKNPREVANQVQVTRELDNILGSVFFSHRHFNRVNNGLNHQLKNYLYHQRALTPPMPWLDNTPPGSIQSVGYRQGIIYWQPPAGEAEQGKRYLVTIVPVRGGQERRLITTNTFTRLDNLLPGGRRAKYHVHVFALDRLNNLSDASQTVVIRF